LSSESEKPSDLDLIREGLTSYWDAKRALKLFATQIQDIARLVLTERLDRLKETLQLGSLDEDQLWPVDEPDPRLDRAAIGTGVSWESGLRLGLGWRASDGNAGKQCIALISARVSAQYKQDSVFRVLNNAAVTSADRGPAITVGRSPRWPWETQVCRAVPAETPLDGIRASLADVLDCFLKWSQPPGALQTAMYG
jgi:hypothetical protein